MLSIHKPFPLFKTTTFGTLAFVVGLGGMVGVLSFVLPHNTNTDKTSTANVATSPSSPDTSKKTTAGTAPTNTATASAPAADPQPAARPVFVAPVSQQSGSYLQPSSPVVQSLANPTPTTTPTQSSTSTATTPPPTSAQTTTATPPATGLSSGSSGSGGTSTTLQGTVNNIPIDPTITTPSLP